MKNTLKKKQKRTDIDALTYRIAFMADASIARGFSKPVYCRMQFGVVSGMSNGVTVWQLNIFS